MSKERIKKSKFNIVDFLIILFCILCLLGIVIRAMNTGLDMKDNGFEEYTVYFKIEDISSDSVDYFIHGDTVRLKSNNKMIGTLEEIVQYVPAVGAYNESGREIFYPETDADGEPTRYSLVGYMTVRGKMTDKGFALESGVYIAANGTLQIVTEHVETTIKIIDLNLK